MKRCFLKKEKKGITLVEILVSIGLMSILSVAIYSSLMGAINGSADAKQRTGAISLVNERMEIFRNLPYEQVGVIGGVGPQGPVPSSEEVDKNGFKYTVNSDVRYIDDPYDGLGETVNTDYKQVEIKVSWANSGKTKSVTFHSKFVPNGIETNQGGGTLSINVLDFLGQPISGARVRIQSVDNNPFVDVSVDTGADGNLIFPGTKSQNYRITVSKSDYETLRTYPNPPASAFTPIDPDVFVEEGALNTKTFIIDKTADLTIRTVNIADSSGIANMEVALEGGRKIGISSDIDNPDVYTTDGEFTSNSSGEIVINDLNPGAYKWKDEAVLSNEEYKFVASDSADPLELLKGEERTMHIMYADKDTDSLLVRLTRKMEDETVVPAANAEVKVTGEGFDQTVKTNELGIAFFPSNESEAVMSNGEYHVNIKLEGHQEDNSDVYINDLTTKEIELQKQ